MTDLSPGDPEVPDITLADEPGEDPQSEDHGPEEVENTDEPIEPELAENEVFTDDVDIEVDDLPVPEEVS